MAREIIHGAAAPCEDWRTYCGIKLWDDCMPKVGKRVNCPDCKHEMKKL